MSEKSTPPLWGVIAAFAAVYLIWGSTYLAIRFSVETLPPFLMASVRFFVAGGLMYSYLWLRDQAKSTWPQIRAATWSGTLMLLGGNGLVCWAEQMVPSGTTALIIGTAPLWIVAMGWLFFREGQPTVAVGIGLVLGLLGVLLLTGPDSLEGEAIHPAGAVALILACVFWAWGSFASRSPSMPSSLLLSTSLQMLGGGGALLAVSLVMGEPMNVNWPGISSKSLASLAYLIVFGSIVAFTCYGWLFRTCKPSLVSTYAYVNPVVAVALGCLLAGEPWNTRIMLAAAFILAGVFLVKGPKTGAPVKRSQAVTPVAVTPVAVTPVAVTPVAVTPVNGPQAGPPNAETVSAN